MTAVIAVQVVAVQVVAVQVVTVMTAVIAVQVVAVLTCRWRLAEHSLFALVFGFFRL